MEFNLAADNIQIRKTKFNSVVSCSSRASVATCTTEPRVSWGQVSLRRSLLTSRDVDSSLVSPFQTYCSSRKSYCLFFSRQLLHVVTPFHCLSRLRLRVTCPTVNSHVLSGKQSAAMAIVFCIASRPSRWVKFIWTRANKQRAVIKRCQLLLRALKRHKHCTKDLSEVTTGMCVHLPSQYAMHGTVWCCDFLLTRHKSDWMPNTVHCSYYMYILVHSTVANSL